MNEHHVTDEELTTAIEAGGVDAESDFRAERVSYVEQHDAIQILTVRNGGFLVPRSLVEPLREVASDDLAALELWPDGSVVEIERLDIHISIDGLIKSVLPALVPVRVIAGLFAAYGGAARSEAKAASSRRNGRKGGRPRKRVA